MRGLSVPESDVGKDETEGVCALGELDVYAAPHNRSAPCFSNKLEPGSNLLGDLARTSFAASET